MVESKIDNAWWERFEDLLEPGKVPLPPLRIVRSSMATSNTQDQGFDFIIEMELLNFPQQRFRFAVQLSTRSSLKYLERSASSLLSSLRFDEFPLLVMPYLSDSVLTYVQEHRLSALDLCGNGLVQVPERLFIKHSGNPNLYPDTQPLQNPYKGRSAMVARAFLETPHFDSVTALHQFVIRAGTSLGLPQVSKSLSRLQDDLVVEKSPKGLLLRDPVRLLDKLAGSWKEPPLVRRYVSLPRPHDYADLLNEQEGLSWVVSGTSSVSRYATFVQGGARRVMVSNIALAQKALGAIADPIASFADLELCETNEPGYYFAPEISGDGVRWANPVQTWLELQVGDARQREAARDVQSVILLNYKTKNNEFHSPL